MQRGLIFGLVAIAIVAVAGLAVWRVQNEPAATPTVAQQAAAPPPAAAPAPAGAPSSPATAPAPDASKPSFDVVRVNPQGETVIAGRAAPGAEVTVLDGDRELGRVTANRNGEWVLLPTQPLAPGDHQLSLTARPPGAAAPSKSDSVVALLVPEGKPPPGAAAPAQPAEPLAVLVPREGNGPARALLLPRDGAAKRKFTLDVIQYDNAGTVELLGRAESKARVEAFLDGKHAGTGQTEPAGSWSVQLADKVPLGRYRLRLEAFGEGGQKLGELALSFSRVTPPEGAVAVDIQPGNNLWRIAQHSYGDGLRYTEIFQANRTQIHDPNLIYPGQVFAVPEQH